MTEVRVDVNSIERLVAVGQESSGEGHRQLLGLRLARTLADLGELVVQGQDLLASFEPLADDPTTDPRFGWPSSRPPDFVELTWPAPKLSREPLQDPELHLTPWALHSLLLGEWGTLAVDAPFRLPECVALLLCDGLTENPAGHDLFRVTGRLEVLTLPAQLHSQILVCGLADGVGQLELEIQIIGPGDIEIGFAIKPVFCPAKDVATFYVANLDQLEVRRAGRYWFVLRFLGEEISRLPIEISDQGERDDHGGWEFGQLWAWESDVFFGERS